MSLGTAWTLDYVYRKSALLDGGYFNLGLIATQAVCATRIHLHRGPRISVWRTGTIEISQVADVPLISDSPWSTGVENRQV